MRAVSISRDALVVTSGFWQTNAIALRAGEEAVLIDSPYLPRDRMVWVSHTRYGEMSQDFIHEAWQSDVLEFFRWFADLPAFGGITAGSRCAWFVDLRFLTPGREAMPFQYGACRDAPDAPWRLTSPGTS